MTVLIVGIPHTAITASIDTATNQLTLSQPQGDLKVDISTSKFFTDINQVKCIAMDDSKIYISTVGTDDSHSCKVLVYQYTPSYMTELTCMDLSSRVYNVERIRLFEQLIFLTEVLHESTATSSTIVTVYSYDTEADEYNIRHVLTPQDASIEEYGLDVAVTTDSIVILGAYQVDTGETLDDCYSLTLYINGKISTLLTGITYDPSELCKIRIDGQSVYMDNEPVATIDNNRLVLCQEQQASYEDEDLIALATSQVPLVSERIDTVTPVAPVTADTKVLPGNASGTAIDRQAMITRQHLLVQQLLNNMSIAIKEDKVERFSIKTLELTEDRIRITGLEFIPRG